MDIKCNWSGVVEAYVLVRDCSIMSRWRTTVRFVQSWAGNHEMQVVWKKKIKGEKGMRATTT